MGKRHKSIATFFGIPRKRHNVMRNVPDVGTGRKRSYFILYFKKGPQFQSEVQLAKQRFIAEIGRECGALVREMNLVTSYATKPGEITMNGVKMRRAMKACTTTVSRLLGGRVVSPDEVKNVFEAHKNEIVDAIRKAVGA